MPMIVSLWSGPRNLSTAMMYFFAHRGDFQVMDEPFFGAFLDKFPVWRPSREIALRQMETKPELVMENIQHKSKHGPLFLKNMANHISLIPEDQALTWKAVILFRDPALVINSYRRKMDQISLFDLAYREQSNWLQKLHQEGKQVYLLDSDDVQRYPVSELKKLCHWLDIPFENRMLSWPAGPLPEDGPWAPYWYERVHQSRGIESREERADIDPSIYEDSLYLECLPYYQILKEAQNEQVQSTRSTQ